MVDAAQLAEYVDNLRALLAQGDVRFGLMVDRQVQAALLPKLSGSRGALEPHLWELLVLCLEGPAGDRVQLDQGSWDKAVLAAQSGQGLSPGQPARFPRAAQALLQALLTLREHGVYPKPRAKP